MIFFVIPAKAGIQKPLISLTLWIPAFAGMTLLTYFATAPWLKFKSNMKETGIVIKKERDTAVVEVLPKKECSKCCSCNAFKKRQVILNGKSAENLKQGDNVEVEIAQSAMMKVYFFLYGLPLIIFVSIMFGVYMLTVSPIISFFSALFSVMTAYLIIGRFKRGTFCLTLVNKV